MNQLNSFGVVNPIDQDPLDPVIENLVKQLGDNRYLCREYATKRLMALDLESLPYLAKAAESVDPEVRFRAKYISEEILDVRPKSGPIPEIWWLPNYHRFIEEHDLAQEYYDEAYIPFRKSRQYNPWFNDVSVVSYSYSEPAQAATLAYISHLRLNKVARPEIEALYSEMRNNEKTCFHLDYVGDFEYVIDKPIPRSCVLTKKVHDRATWEYEELVKKQKVFDMLLEQ